jgi:hypothetical protein
MPAALPDMLPTRARHHARTLYEKPENQDSK